MSALPGTAVSSTSQHSRMYLLREANSTSSSSTQQLSYHAQKKKLPLLPVAADAPRSAVAAAALQQQHPACITPRGIHYAALLSVATLLALVLNSPIHGPRTVPLPEPARVPAGLRLADPHHHPRHVSVALARRKQDNTKPPRAQNRQVMTAVLMFQVLWSLLV